MENIENNLIIKNLPFVQRVILGLLTPMKNGFLTIELPSGETLNFGENPKGHNAEIKINNEAFFKRLLLNGDIGLGESFLEGEWETPNLTAVIEWFINNIEDGVSISGSKRKGVSPLKLFNTYLKFKHGKRENTKKGSRENIRDHYDLSNEMYQNFLDESMTYSSALFIDGKEDLHQAQMNKYKNLADMVQLKETDHVLEIGTGWGGFAIFMAKNYGCKITTVTISKEQYDFAKERVEKEGLQNQVTLLLQDYRDIEGSFDKVVSIEMIEAVGEKYFNTYFAKISKLLKKDGLVGIQAITYPSSRYEEYVSGVDFIQKYIFPGGLCPSLARLTDAYVQSGDFELYGFKDFGKSYGKTLSMWRDNFNNRTKEIKELGFDDRFIRMWNYYFSYCEAGFRKRNISVVQLLLSKPNNNLY